MNDFSRRSSGSSCSIRLTWQETVAWLHVCLCLLSSICCAFSSCWLFAVVFWLLICFRGALQRDTILTWSKSMLVEQADMTRPTVIKVNPKFGSFAEEDLLSVTGVHWGYSFNKHSKSNRDSLPLTSLEQLILSQMFFWSSLRGWVLDLFVEDSIGSVYLREVISSKRAGWFFPISLFCSSVRP